ncbi:protein cramped-like [Palaemon carinicauda]|uniref:protein cramped-like n=1 Tax=Palaemon carinicauda TaxID=392227 RepID=UPI0035B68189
MVKRKRTLSVKDNSENVNQTSDAGLIYETKRSKVADLPLRAERQDNGVEHSSSLQNLTMPPTSQTLTSSGSSGVTVPLSISQSLPNVPLPSAPNVPQSRPTPQLRTSARVLNKQRREETKADLANIIATANKKAEANVKTEFAEEEDGNRGSGNNEKKRRRAWELWSTEDKNIFFESINECGKDFEAIQNYLTTKLRKKGTPGYQIKNKDQVRHFYYRTWHKISKYITFSEGVKKATQELYGLINYGELRKKIGSILDERKAQKLQELIRKGSTSVRVKGKSVRVRTPICRALKKLNQIEEHREHREIRVPRSIVLEILPLTMEAWCRVQGLAHNPRVRVTTSPQKPLSTVLSHLQEKWRNANMKLRETLVSRVNFPLELDPVKEPVLRLLPPAGCCIKPLNIQPDIIMKSSAVSLQSHEARLRRCGEDLIKSEKRKESSKQAGNKSSTGVEDGFSKDMEECGRSGEQSSEAEQSGTNSEGPKNEAQCSQGGNNSVCKGRDSEALSVDLDDYAGEASQEELEEGSDVEPDCLNSPDVDNDDTILKDNRSSLPVFNSIYLKEEQLDYLSPPTSIMDPLDLHDQEDPFDPDLKVKEEGESGDALRQLIALETVANSQNVDDDAEVVCVGESTRLTALVGKGHRGHSSGTNQGELAPEDRVLVGTPEPEEEEKDLDSEEKPSTADVDKFIDKIRKGWVLSSVGGITVGELYLMFGQNKKVSLEYEFVYVTEDEKVESPSSVTSSKESLSISPTRSVNSNSQIVAGLSTPTVSSVGLMSAGTAEVKNLSPGNENTQKNGSELLSEQKPVSVENLSGMLQQLLSMARVILAKPNDSCSCGHVCGRGTGGLRSPASSRGQGLCGVNRSPGNTKSPRNCRVASVGAHSPVGIRSPISQSVGRNPLAAKSPKDRCKPASAKKLIPDSVVEMDGNNELPLLNPSSSLNANSVVPGQDPASKAPVANIDGVTRVKVVVGSGGDGGEFRVPTAPAPRPVQTQQASFNAQLTKLLPQYNNRPGRRVLRKSVVVQRQLPLLPKARSQPTGVIAMKVLPHVIQKFDLEGNQIKSYLPISKATSQGSQLRPSAQAVNAHIVASSLNVGTPIQVDHPVNPNTIQLTSQQTLPTPQRILPSMPVVSTNPPATNAISVNVSGQPLLTVELPAPVTSPNKQPGILSGDSCLPGVVSAPPVTDLSELLKPALLVDNTQSQITVVTKSPVKSSVYGSDNSNPLTPRKIDNLINSAVSLSQSFNYALSGDSKESLSPVSTNANSSNTNINGILNSMVSEALSDLPDLSTPPGTPHPFSSTKSSGESTSFLSQLENISSSVSTTTAYPCIPSPLLFNSSLSLDSLPSLNNGLPVNTQLVSALPTTTTSVGLSNMPAQIASSLTASSVTTSLSPCTSLLATPTTSHLELSPSPMQTNSFSSLLNTPTPHSTHNNPSSSGGDISPPTPLTALLHSPSAGSSKNFSNMLDSNGRSSASGLAVPDLYIPEGSLNLPLLDISMGGTVSLNEQASGLLNSELDSKGAEYPESTTAKHDSSDCIRSSTPTPIVSSENCMQGTSSDKLLDITLGISNSNSSFSSLLASATQTPKVLDSSILGALNMDNLDCGTESGNRGGVGNVLEGISGVEISGFPALDTSTPSPPPSPSRLLQQGDNQWLNNEVNDFSLSSFLGHFDSPVKGSTSRGSSQSNPPDLPMPSLVTVYNENSVDFIAKFAEMKAKASHTYKN